MFAKRKKKLFVLLTAVLIPILLTGLLLLLEGEEEQRNFLEDYAFLTSLNPEDILIYQSTFPEDWREMLIASLLEKAQGIEDIQKARQTYETILEEYAVYEPGRYGFPVAETCYFTDTYGAEREGGARTHEGTDLFQEKGTLILSVCPGEVERLGWNRLGGERVGIRGEDGNYYYYAHLDRIAENLEIGQQIKKGQLLGYMGNTGDAVTTPDHLHFGIEIAPDCWINPYPLLKIWEHYHFR